MNNTFRSILLFASFSLVLLAPDLAFARAPAKVSSTPVSTGGSAAGISVAGLARKGLGFASVEGLTGTATSVTGWMELDSSNSVQAFFGIPSTSPFQFSLGRLYHHNVASKGGASFHVGGGFAAGLLGAAKADFALSLIANMGIRYQLENAPVFVSLDGGPGFSLVDGNSDFSIGAHSGILGASVIYVF